MLRTLYALLLVITLHQSSLIGNQGISLADDYKKNSGLQWEWAIDSLNKFSFNPYDNVLDVGSGDGKITALIAKQIPKGLIVGMDISENMVTQSSSQFFHYENLQFLQGTATAIPYSMQFDKVVSFCALHWVIDQEKALHSMKNSLKSGGTLLLVLPGKAPNNLASLSEKIASSEKWSNYFPIFKQERVYYTQEEYTKLLEEADFKIQSIEMTENVTYYKDKAALIAWIKPLVNFIGHLNPSHQEMFINEIAMQMFQNDPPLPDGSIGIHHVKIEVIAMKP